MVTYALPIEDVSSDLLRRWSSLHRASRQAVGPFLHPSYARAVGRVRPSIEVGVLEEAGRAVGFLPFERLALEVGGAVGGRLCDRSGVLLEDGAACDPYELTRGLGLRALRLASTSRHDPVLGSCVGATKRSPYMDLSSGFERYRDASRESGSRITKQVGQRFRKLRREHDRVDFAWHTEDDETLRELLAWKAAQRRATRTANVLELPWASALIDVLRTESFDGIQPVLSSLRIDGKVAAAHFGIRTDRVLHYWIAGYDNAFSRYSPGLITLMEVARTAPERGIERIDLGPGEERYKVRAATGFLDLGRATVTTSRALESAMSAMDGVRRWSRGSPLGESVRATGRTLTRAVYAVRAALGAPNPS